MKSQVRWIAPLSVVTGLVLLLTVLNIQAGAPFDDLTLAAQTDYDFVADFEAIVAPPPPAYGTNLWWTDDEAELWASRWTELGPSMVRVPVFHAIVEPMNDNDDPNAINWDGFLLDTPISVPGIGRTVTYGTWFQALRDQPAVNILIYFPYLAPWLTDNPPHPGLPFDLAPHPPNDLAEYREFVQAVLRYLVETLGFPPERIAVEAMNEPDLQCYADPVVACFWRDWIMDDIVAVTHVTHEAIESVNAEIPLLGLAECCGVAIVRDLLDNYPEGAYLDGLSYHYYSHSGFNLETALSRAAALSSYDRPIYLDEYGSQQYRSEGVDGALWHSWALTTLWEAGIAPLQYPITDWPLLGEPFGSMGLFKDWREDWVRKPAYWIYANSFAHLGAADLISYTAPSQVDTVVGRRATAGSKVRVVFWLTNRAEVELSDQQFAIYNFPTDQATLYVYDNLAGPEPVLTETATGLPMTFVADLPARSSRTFVLSALVYPPTLTNTPTATPTNTPAPTATPTPTSTPAAIHVANIEMNVERTFFGIFGRGRAEVTTVDQNGQPLVGATVEGAWSGLVSGTRNANTDTGGIAALTSSWTWSHGTFTFTVQDLTDSGYAYDPAANEETSDSISW